ncbi:MAG: membrane protein insertion efficiency factor YidD [Synergistaceae bacterium]|nr:membrane protein insertion efficiency factor YidD [Synergistaceae bacterium]
MFAKFAIFLIQCYKRFISPMLGHNCRFIPSCSEYAVEAYTKYGFIKGSYLTITRLLRCAPWGKGGYDPIP